VNRTPFPENTQRPTPDAANHLRPSGSLPIVRAPFFAAFLTLLSCAQGQSSGTYAPNGGTAQSWSISAGHALVWDGKPYMPIGLRIDGSAQEIAKAQKAGASDVIVDLPANGRGWKDAFAALEAAHTRYFLSLGSLAPMAHGFSVEPEANRVTGITEKRTIDFDLPGSKSALAVLVTRRDNDVQELKRVQLTNGHFSYLAQPKNDLEHVLYVFPETDSLETPDCWEGLDQHRDSLLAALRQSPPGAGLRGIINPAGQLVTLKAGELRFVPKTPFFQLEYRTFLEAKYRSVETLQRSWGMRASGIEDFETMSRLVPLFSSAGPGLPMLWDPKNDRTYIVDQRHSHLWPDLREMVGSAMSRRLARLASAIRSVANVPILQDWAGWSNLTEADSPFDGVGVQVDGSTPSQVAAAGSRGVSSVLRWTKPGLLIATRVRSDKDSVASTVEDLTSMGTRGCFFTASDEATAKADLAVPTPDASVADSTPNPLFFPENAMNPAQAQRLPFGRWWLPAPTSGNRIDLGSRFFGYRMDESARASTVIWTTLPAGRYKLHFANTTGVMFESVDGVDPKPKVGKGVIEVTMGNYPLIVSGTEEIPIPDIALNETNVRYAALLTLLEGKNSVATEERYAYADPLKAFDRNPGGSFSAMRTVYQKLAMRMAPFTWIEGEATRDHNFSGAMFLPECSNGGCLVLRTRLDDPAQSYKASYTVPARSGAEQEVWIAAKIPSGAKDAIQVSIGGQLMTAQTGPLSPYGSGFAWYKMGTTRVSSGSVRVNVLATPRANSEIAIDAILLYPGTFTPSGVSVPDPVDFETLLAPKPKGKKG